MDDRRRGPGKATKREYERRITKNRYCRSDRTAFLIPDRDGGEE